MHDIRINPTLDKSATPTVRPFFLNKDPDFDSFLATDIEFGAKGIF
jgi:hypothetical protein